MLDIYRDLVRICAVGLIVLVGWFLWLSHQPLHDAKPATESSASIVREIAAVIQADRVLAASHGGVPLSAGPAVSVIREAFPGLSPGEVNAILGALKPTTREVIGATSKIIAPTPSPVPMSSPDAHLYEIDKAALQDVLNDPNTHIATAVTVTREEVAPSRVGSAFAPNGSGLSYAAFRRGRFEVNLGLNQRNVHLSPSVGFDYLIPHTSLSIGPRVLYDRGAHYGIEAVVHF